MHSRTMHSQPLWGPHTTVNIQMQLRWVSQLARVTVGLHTATWRQCWTLQCPVIYLLNWPGSQWGCTQPPDASAGHSSVLWFTYLTATLAKMPSLTLILLSNAGRWTILHLAFFICEMWAIIMQPPWIPGGWETGLCDGHSTKGSTASHGPDLT